MAYACMGLDWVVIPCPVFRDPCKMQILVVIIIIIIVQQYRVYYAVLVLVLLRYSIAVEYLHLYG
jgi:hypothetical protein